MAVALNRAVMVCLRKAVLKSVDGAAYGPVNQQLLRANQGLDISVYRICGSVVTPGGEPPDDVLHILRSMGRSSSAPTTSR